MTARKQRRQRATRGDVHILGIMIAIYIDRTGTTVTKTDEGLAATASTRSPTRESHPRGLLGTPEYNVYLLASTATERNVQI